jgi:hypothetical protein
VTAFPIELCCGSAIELPIRFEPATIGSKSATITIESTDPASPHTVAVSGFEGCRCPGCETLTLVRDPFPATLHPGAALDLVLQYTATGGSACTRHLVIHCDDHPVVTIDVSAMTKMTLNGALQGWPAGRLRSLLATRVEHPCDDGDPGDDAEC